VTLDKSGSNLIGVTAERPTHAVKDPKNVYPRSSKARQESFALLTKTYHGSRVTGQAPYHYFT